MDQKIIKQETKVPSTNLQAAFSYLDKNLSIIPVGSDKLPLIKWSPYQERRPTTEEVLKWWTQWPDANIGLITGKVSGLIAYDADSPGAIGLIEDLLPDNFENPIQETPRGGRHYLFAYREGIKNATAIRPDLDVRGEGGYIVIAPSKGYTWLDGLALGESSLTDLPEPLFDLYKTKNSSLDESNPQDFRDKKQEILKGVKEGQRNDSLTRLVGSYISKGLLREEILAILEKTNSKFQPPLPQEEVETILDSVIKTDAKNHPKKEDQPEDLSYTTLTLPTSLEISQLEMKVEWVVENLIPKESTTLLHSIGGVGKSYLLYQLAKSVAEDEMFFGLNVKPMEVFYIDFENPLPEIVDRMKKIGGSNNLRIWHLGHDPMPIRFDADEWKIYKTFPQGLFIIDSLRSSHLLDENSSKDASFVMARLKEIRALGSTIILIHHESKMGGYRGSTAWFDLSDHILKFSRVKKIGSDEDADQEDPDCPIRLGLGGKSRFSGAMDLKPMFFQFENQLLVRAEDPDIEFLKDLHTALVERERDNLKPPNNNEFKKMIYDLFKIKDKGARKLIIKGNGLFWNELRDSERTNIKVYASVHQKNRILPWTK